MRAASTPAWLREQVESLWWRDPRDLPWLARALLGPLSAGFEWLVRRRRESVDQGRRHPQRLPVATLVVGNRIVGGAGKTPCTLALLEALGARGWHPGVVSAGHGRDDDEVREVDPLHSTARQVGDEPLLIARRSGVPVWVGRERAQAARDLLHRHPEVDLIVCDDGLQHDRLARDLEVMLWDERGAGNGRLLPLGPLREPLDLPGLAPRRWVVHNRAAASPAAPDGHTAWRELAGAWPLADWWSGRATGRPDWKDLSRAVGTQALIAVAGIAEPGRFFRALEVAGFQVDPRPCVDHADHAELPFERGAGVVVVTEKDAVKLDPARLARERPGTQVWVAPLTLTLPTRLVDEIDAELRRLSRPDTLG